MKLLEPVFWRDKKNYRHPGKRYSLRFRDPRGREHILAAFTDKSASVELGNKIDRLIISRGSGKLPDASLLEWADGLPAAWREKFIKWGLLHPRSGDAGKPLSVHIADYQAYLESKRNTCEYVKTSTARLTAIREALGAEHWTDLDAERVRDYLARRRNLPAEDKESLSAASVNHYLRALKSFCRWMVLEGRAAESPVARLNGFKKDEVHARRALTTDELHRLLTAAKSGPIRSGVDGREREWLYRLAAETGLRARELRSLTRASFDLDSDPPIVTIEAAYSKNRRRDSLPLRPETAEELRTFLAGKMPRALVFSLPPWLAPIKIFRPDLKAAGIDYRDSAGRVADFHSLRHTFITNLARGKVSPRLAQSLARHSTITLTMDRYSHSFIGDEAEAVATLPDLSAAARLSAQAAAVGAGPEYAPGDGANRTPEYSPAQVAKRGVLVAAPGREGNCGKVNDEMAEVAESPIKTAESVGRREDSDKRGRRGSNPQPPDRQSIEKHTKQAQKSANVAGTPEYSPGLAVVMAAWPTLQEAMRVGIVAMVKAAVKRE